MSNITNITTDIIHILNATIDDTENWTKLIPLIVGLTLIMFSFIITLPVIMIPLVRNCNERNKNHHDDNSKDKDSNILKLKHVNEV